jgi:hypothetical protein
MRRRSSLAARRLLLIDAGIAVVLAALVLIISPGLAVTGMIAIFVLLVCGISIALQSRRARRRSRRSSRPASRRPPRSPSRRPTGRQR